MVENRLALEDKKMRKWLYKQGKGHLLDFSDKELKSLQEVFDSLDVKGTGSIGVDQLE